jgi:hypothetical protein
MLPLPDLPLAAGPRIRGSRLTTETADVDGSVPAPEADGRRIRDGVRVHLVHESRTGLGLGWGLGLGGRFTFGDGNRSGGHWLERHLVHVGERSEVTIGLSRGFWGDGQSGSLLLGRTAPPLEMVRFRSARPWRFPGLGERGRIQASIFLAYLDDRYRTIPFPLLQGTRVEWEPTSFLRLNAARTILFGGAGRTKRLKADDLWDIWWGRDENVVGVRDVSDSDQKASLGFELRLPPKLRLAPWVNGARFFYEYGGEDSFEGILPTTVAHHYGGSLSSLGWTGFVELLETTDDANTWYTDHTVYGSGSYFYRGYLLGHPFGPDARGGQIRLWSPPLGDQRIQVWFRTRGTWDRATDTTLFWEDAWGGAIRREMPGGASIAEVSFETFRARDGEAEAPDLDLHWRIQAGLRSTLSASTQPKGPKAGALTPARRRR